LLLARGLALGESGGEYLQFWVRWRVSGSRIRQSQRGLSPVRANPLERRVERKPIRCLEEFVHLFVFVQADVLAQNGVRAMVAFFQQLAALIIR
jgi:hypothetical protein